MKLLFVIVLSVWSTILCASSEKYIIGLSGEDIQAVWDESEAYALVSLEDPRGGDMPGDANSDARINENKTHLSAKLWYEDVLMAHHAAPWEIKVNYYIELIELGTGNMVTRYESLVIDYSPNGEYADIQIRDYPGFISANLILDNVEVNTTITNFQIPKDVRLDLVLAADRYYKLTNTNPPTFFTLITPNQVTFNGNLAEINAGESSLPVMWSQVAEAESYDLEWLFVDCLHGQHHNPDAVDPLPDLDPEIDFRNATRVNVSTNYYDIPLGYPEGYLILRVRPVGINMSDMTNRVEGNWTHINADIPYLSDALLESNSANPFVFIFNGIETNMNWQYTAGFAEEGKRKESLNFFDGALRPRQSMTILNTEDNALVGESHYDFQGRPAFQILPSPLANQGLKFYSNLNGDYDKQDFDIQYYNTPSLTALPGEEGGHRYFSSANTDFTGTHEAYVPDAEGYPFSRSIYTNDGTNRLAVQSGAGKAHRIVDPSLEGDHTQKMYYTTPTQAELDRLFGNNAGIASHYQKIVSKDANRQHTVAYLDQEGRTVATALLGGDFATTHLIDLDGRPDVADLASDLLVNNEIVQNGDQNYVLASSTFSVPIADTRMFHYSITPDYFTTCSGEDLYCEYDLSIIIYNEFGEEVLNFDDLETNLGTYPLVNNITANNYPDYTVSWEVNLDPGTYQVVKKLTIDESSIQTAHDNLLTDLEAFNPVIVPFVDGESAIYADQENQLNFNLSDGVVGPLTLAASQNLLTNEAILVGGLNAGNQNVCISFNYEVPVCNCDDETDVESDETCEKNTFEANDCYDIYWAMIADLSPGGQYFDNLPAKFHTESGILVENSDYNDGVINEIDAWLNAKTEREYFYTTTPNTWWDNSGIEPLQPNTGNSGDLINSIQNIYDALTLGSGLSWGGIREKWYNEWGEEWPALKDLYFDPEHGYMPFDVNGDNSVWRHDALVVLDNLFHLHPEAMSYENVCDIRAYDEYFSINDSCVSNYSLPDKENIDFINLMNSVTGDDYVEINIDGINIEILQAIDLGLFYAPFDFYGGNDLLLPDCRKLDGTHLDLDLSCTGLAPFQNNSGYYIQNDDSGTPTIQDLGNYLNMSFTEFENESDIVFGNEIKDPMGCEERQLLVDELMNFMPLADGSSYMSIYAVLDDPLGVATWNGTSYDTYTPGTQIGQDQIDAIRAIHDQFNVHGLSKWDFFKSTYLFYREKVNRKTAFSVSGRVNDNDEIPTVSDINDNDAHTTETSFIHQGDPSGLSTNNQDILYGVSGGYWLYFPHNPIFDSEFETYQEITAGLAESCTAECNTRVSLVLEDLQTWINEQGLTPMTTDDYASLEAELLDICECGCTNSWESMSETQLNNLDSYLDAEIEYYSCTDEFGVTSTFDSEIHNFVNANNEDWSGFTTAPLDLSEAISTTSYTQSIGDCSCDLMTAYVYHHYNDIFTGSLDPNVTEADFTLYVYDGDNDSWDVPAYINLSELRSHLNSDPQFQAEASFQLYPTNTDLEDLIALCHASDKDYCVDSEDPETCFDALVTGSSNLPTTDSDYIFPLREAFLCELNNPTMAEMNTLECLGLWELELDNAMTAYHNEIAEVMDGFYANMLATGLAAQETFTMNYSLDEFAYTLYYYDQAGNLVQTVPPSGVKILPYDANNTIGDDDYTIQDVVAHRLDESNPFILPEHTLKTQYQYNTLNNLRENQTPDGGASVFFYDALGRLIVSQNARQATTNSYSYTFYDELGRPYETGEVENPDVAMSQTLAGTMDMIGLVNWVNDGFEKHDVVRTFYDDHIAFPEIAAAFGNQQRHVRNRISGVVKYKTFAPNNFVSSDYVSGTFYSYDIHGNVNRMVQVNKALEPLGQHIKTFDYTYDLVSGNVHQVAYQSGEWDQFYYRYEYDADNRLTYAFSSKNGRIWEKESRQYYYAHGPLARTEIGDKQVQAEDFAYTIHGWLKGVNSSTKQANRDIGKDGHDAANNLHAHFAQDAFAYHLSYYQNADCADYTSIGQTPGTDYFLATQSGAVEAQRRDLYNGNISMMVHTMSGNGMDVPTETNASRFMYDQLNRIKGSVVYFASEASMTNGNDLSAAVQSPYYYSTYEYDFNGNIQKLVRTGNDMNNLFMDGLKYQYKYNADGKLVSNRLRQVNESAMVNNDAYDVDIDDQGAYNSQAPESDFNYTYDETGQLIGDKTEHIVDIEWTPTGKVSAIKRGAFSDIDDGNYPADLEFKYDPFGHRIAKIVKPRNAQGILLAPQHWAYTYYTRDAQGNPITTYETGFEPLVEGGYYDADGYSHDLTLSQDDIHLYGAKRLGLKQLDRTLTGRVDVSGNGDDVYDIYTSEFNDNGTALTIFIDELDDDGDYDADQTTRRLSLSHYELTDHRGNVYNVISDRKVTNTHQGNMVLTYAADVQSATDYYPFGMPLPGRNFTTEGYRYGFNGKENDDEIKGKGNFVSFEFREYDPRIAKFKSIDPLYYKYAWQSPYAFAANSPIALIDVLGLGPGGVDPEKEENRVIEPPDQGTKDGLDELNKQLNKIKELYGDIKKVHSLAKNVEIMIKYYDGEEDPMKFMDAYSSFYSVASTFLTGLSNTPAGFTNGQFKVLWPLIKEQLNLIAHGARERSKLYQQYGLEEIAYAGSFIGGHEMYNFLSELKGVKEEYIETYGEDAWDKFQIFESNIGNFEVPSSVKSIVMNNHEFFSLISDIEVPYKKRTAFGLDFLAKDYEDYKNCQLAWWWGRLEKFENVIYGGARIKSR